MKNKSVILDSGGWRYGASDLPQLEELTPLFSTIYQMPSAQIIISNAHLVNYHFHFAQWLNIVQDNDTQHKIKLALSFLIWLTI
ncbi:unnamed protein product [Citrullus colocynthis]|uniref:Uncharacterized protein n=1 Tax=Citrullus colocynthis TaxID=252529 RepID=A0ABP0Y9S8_9ROSI